MFFREYFDVMTLALHFNCDFNTLAKRSVFPLRTTHLSNNEIVRILRWRLVNHTAKFCNRFFALNFRTEYKLPSQAKCLTRKFDVWCRAIYGQRSGAIGFLIGGAFAR
jgi:hypothetical protein